MFAKAELFTYRIQIERRGFVRRGYAAPEWWCSKQQAHAKTMDLAEFYYNHKIKLPLYENGLFLPALAPKEASKGMGRDTLFAVDAPSFSGCRRCD